MKKAKWTLSARCASGVALLALSLGGAFFAACDDSSSSASNSSIPEYKTAANLPDSCEMEVAKVDTAYFACFENKWIEVTDSATIEQFKDGMDESKIKEKLEELEDMLKPAPAKPKSSDSKEGDVESSDDSEEPESSAAEECTGRHCKTGSSSSRSSGGNGGGSGGNGGGEEPDTGSSSSSESGTDSSDDSSSSGDVNPSSSESDTESSSSTESSASAENLCGGVAYDPENAENKCIGDVLYKKCGDTWYNSKTQQCSSGEISGLCSGTSYDLSESVCDNGTLVAHACGGSNVWLDNVGVNRVAVLRALQSFGLGLTAAKSVCDAAPTNVFSTDVDIVKAQNVLVTLVDSGATATIQQHWKTYDPLTEMCSAGNVLKSCGGQPYNSDVLSCSTDGKVSFKGLSMSASSTSLDYGDYATITLPGKSKCTYVVYGSDGSVNSDYASAGWGETTETDCSIKLENINSLSTDVEATVGLKHIYIGNKIYTMLKIKGGSANPAPPVGPALGEVGINIMDFCRQFNALTSGQTGTIFSVLIEENIDKTFTFVTNYSDEPSFDVTLKGNPCKDQLASDEFCDVRDNQVYKKVTINKVTWTAENMKYKTSGTSSVCYLASNDNCDTYGRLYTLAGAQAACPSGWHLPTKEEYENLIVFADGEISEYAPSSNAATNLLANGDDKYGFGLLLAGYCTTNSPSSCSALNSRAELWAESTDKTYANVYYNSTKEQYIMQLGNELYDTYRKSVRCVKDK